MFCAGEWQSTETPQLTRTVAFRRELYIKPRRGRALEILFGSYCYWSLVTELFRFFPML